VGHPAAASVEAVFPSAICDELVSRLVGPLSPLDRIAFRQAAEEALALLGRQ
jgi:hypothetical protein